MASISDLNTRVENRFNEIIKSNLTKTNFGNRVKKYEEMLVDARAKNSLDQQFLIGRLLLSLYEHGKKSNFIASYPKNFIDKLESTEKIKGEIIARESQLKLAKEIGEKRRASAKNSSLNDSGIEKSEENIKVEPAYTVFLLFGFFIKTIML